MTHLHFDCFAGICGSMVLGALVDAGLDFDDLKRDLALLPLDGYDITAEKVTRRGIAGTLVQVRTDEDHPHRGLAQVEAIINESALPDVVKVRGCDVFRALARAEAKIHDTTVETIHFHEVGAVDAIIDIMGSLAGLHRLGVTGVSSSPVHTGSGFVDCAHGRLPVPAPATAELLRGVPTYAEHGIEKELTTPTGAALVTTLATSFGPPPALEVAAIGYGAGTHELPIANLLRIFIGTPAADVGVPTGMVGVPAVAATTSGTPDDTETTYQEDTVIEARTAIDDMSPEWTGYLFERLYEAGALEVYTTPIYMKKNRPGHLLTFLSPPAAIDALLEVLFRESTTLGVRTETVARRTLARKTRTVTTPYGDVRVKIAGGNVAPEYEDCRRLAESSGQPLKVIYEAARVAAGAGKDL